MADPASGYLVDSNVLLDILTRDATWFDWSASTLAGATRSSVVRINPLIFAEVSTRMPSLDALEELLPARMLKRAPLPYEAGFLAGKAFLAYKKRGGDKRSPLPDFYIGAHAVVQGLTLITRDVGRYRTYFPTLQLVSPDRQT